MCEQFEGIEKLIKFIWIGGAAGRNRSASVRNKSFA
jgi:hypothetical protein